MNRNIGILFGVVLPADCVFANDISAETTSFTSTVTRAEVVAELTREQALNPFQLRRTESSSRERHAQIDHRALVR